MINARAETLQERPAYRQALERFRCLIPADGFFEWRAVEAAPGATSRPAKQPFHITRADGGLFAFAGLWSTWRGPGGDRLRTCTIITTAANATVLPLHDRMPVMLDAAGEDGWLDSSTPRDLLAEMLRGLPAEQTVVRPVSSAVNDARFDGPECLSAPVLSQQPALF